MRACHYEQSEPQFASWTCDDANSTVRLHLWDGSLPLDSFRAVRMPATEAVGPEAVMMEIRKRFEQAEAYPSARAVEKVE